jgi:redox-sensitive bicupin YhaK (pirin superfamily)
MNTPRTIFQIVDSKTTTEGEGFTVHRPFPNSVVRDFDPFLLLDEMGPIDLLPNQAKGAPDHPHRGFETVTYVLEGSFEHKDSRGNVGNLLAGDVQWMTAGSGVIHSEMPEKEFAKNGGRLHAFQLWINLPKKDKMTQPRYQDVPSKKIPTAVTADGKVHVKVIAGESLNKNSQISTKIPILYLHLSMAPSSSFVQIVPKSFNIFAYVAKGKANFGKAKQLVKQEQAVFFKRDGDKISISVPEDSNRSTEILLIGGSPIEEPVVRYGPFVMNTDEEIQQAIEDYKNGKMGKIDF